MGAICSICRRFEDAFCSRFFDGMISVPEDATMDLLLSGWLISVNGNNGIIVVQGTCRLNSISLTTKSWKTIYRFFLSAARGRFYPKSVQGFLGFD